MNTGIAGPSRRAEALQSKRLGLAREAFGPAATNNVERLIREGKSFDEAFGWLMVGTGKTQQQLRELLHFNRADVAAVLFATGAFPNEKITRESTAAAMVHGWRTGILDPPALRTDAPTVVVAERGRDILRLLFSGTPRNEIKDELQCDERAIAPAISELYDEIRPEARNNA